MDNGFARRLRHAVIGAGAGVLKVHLPALLSDGVDLAAVTDVNEELGRRRAVELACDYYADHREVLADKLPDVCMILAPQPFRASIAIDRLEAGSHSSRSHPQGFAAHGGRCRGAQVAGVGECHALLEPHPQGGDLAAGSGQVRLYARGAAYREEDYMNETRVGHERNQSSPLRARSDA